MLHDTVNLFSSRRSFFILIFSVITSLQNFDRITLSSGGLLNADEM